MGNNWHQRQNYLIGESNEFTEKDAWLRAEENSFSDGLVAVSIMDDTNQGQTLTRLRSSSEKATRLNTVRLYPMQHRDMRIGMHNTGEL